MVFSLLFLLSFCRIKKASRRLIYYSRTDIETFSPKFGIFLFISFGLCHISRIRIKLMIHGRCDHIERGSQVRYIGLFSSGRLLKYIHDNRFVKPPMITTPFINRFWRRQRPRSSANFNNFQSILSKYS